jgi:hypothetical protein
MSREIQRCFVVEPNSVGRGQILRQIDGVEPLDFAELDIDSERSSPAVRKAEVIFGRAFGGVRGVLIRPKSQVRVL